MSETNGSTSFANLQEVGILDAGKERVGVVSEKTKMPEIDITRAGLQQLANSGKKLYKFFKHLEQTENLPTLVFNFDRGQLRGMCAKLCKYMQSQQNDKYLGTEEARKKTKEINKNRRAAWEAECKKIEAMLKLKANDEDFDETAQDLPPEPN